MAVLRPTQITHCHDPRIALQAKCFRYSRGGILKILTKAQRICPTLLKPQSLGDGLDPIVPRAAASEQAGEPIYQNQIGGSRCASWNKGGGGERADASST
jgi:hypothetical protein